MSFRHLHAPGHPYGLVSERKSRRTHKNSRDGCPNCKAKRIKCLEELPSCRNCIKKNYRCGYLDFPKDRLDHIRLKNEIKLLEDQVTEHEPEPAMPEPAAGRKTNGNASSKPHFVGPAFTEQLLKPVLEHFETDQPIKSLVDLRLFVYRNSMLKFTKDTFEPDFASMVEHEYNQDQLPTFKPFDYDHRQDHEMATNTDDGIFGSGPATVSSENSIADPSELSLSAYPEFKVYPAPVGEKGSFAPPVLTKEQRLLLRKAQEPSISPATMYGHLPLPQSRQVNTTFKKLKITGELKNRYLRRYLTEYRSHLKNLINEDFAVYFAPVWNNKMFRNFWTTVFHQSVVLNVYFSFFMDRSLNVLLKTCNVIVSGDVFSSDTPSSDSALSSLLSSYSVSSPNSPKILAERHKKRADGFFFTNNDLMHLTKKSYTYYGVLIRNLRESISNFHIEYPTKMSLFLAWSVFLHLHATVETLTLMYNGTALLFCKICNEATSLNDITPTIRVGMDVFANHALAARVPDYRFDAVVELYESFCEFRVLCEEYSEKYASSGDARFENSTRSFLNSKLTRHDVLELNKFFVRLIHDYYPSIMKLNDFYKVHQQGASSQNPEDASNIKYTSVTLFFEMLVHWFRIFPSEMLSMGSQMSPMKKIFYLIYTALGRLLVHVFLPIRSLMLIDTCHVFCPKVDFESNIYRFSRNDVPFIDDATHDYLQQLSHRLLRMINFFDYRMILYSCYLAKNNPLAQEYMLAIEPVMSDGLGGVHDIYSDIVDLLPAKTAVREVQIASFKNTTITLDNFPRWDDVEAEEELYDLVIKQALYEQHQHMSDSSMDYDVGLLRSEFNPKGYVKLMNERGSRLWYLRNLDILGVRTVLANFELSRREMKRSIDRGVSGK